MLEHMYITIPVHEMIFIKQGQVHPEGLKNSSEIAPYFQHSFNTHSILIQYSFNTVQYHLHFRTFPSKSLHYPNECLTFAPSVLAKPLNNAQIVRGVFCL